MELQELKKRIQDAGIVGAGGAGFPTYAKLSENARTILLNCAECEPLLKLHRQLLALHAEEILEAFSLIADTLGAEEGIIGIKSEYRETIEALRGPIGRYPKLRIHELPGVYPMGDEVVLIYEATGRQIRPGGLPIEAGVAVFNVETVYNVSRSLRSGTPVVDKVISVVGEVEHPVTVRVPLGTPLSEVVKMAGAVTTRNLRYLVGGPMMGRFGSPSDPVTKTTNAILVLPEEHLLIQKMSAKLSVQLKRAASVCCQCQMCTDLCPRHALGHPIEPHKFMRSAANQDFRDTNVFLNTFFCSSCGTCELYSCPQGLSPRTLITAYKNGLRAKGVKAPADITAATVRESREYRKAPEGRLEARLGLTRYDKPAPLTDSVISVSRVYELLSQHIGAPAIPCVKAGERVERGQRIADPGNGLSVPIHASISGIVKQVSEREIVIDII